MERLMWKLLLRHLQLVRGCRTLQLIQALLLRIIALLRIPLLRHHIARLAIHPLLLIRGRNTRLIPRRARIQLAAWELVLRLRLACDLSVLLHDSCTLLLAVADDEIHGDTGDNCYAADASYDAADDGACAAAAAGGGGGGGGGDYTHGALGGGGELRG
jgi:hypothetical protein